MSADMVDFDFEIVEDGPFQQMKKALQQCKKEKKVLDLQLKAAMDRQNSDLIKIHRLTEENEDKKDKMENLKAKLAEVKEESRRVGAELENQLRLSENETAQNDPAPEIDEDDDASAADPSATTKHRAIKLPNENWTQMLIVLMLMFFMILAIFMFSYGVFGLISNCEQTISEPIFESPETYHDRVTEEVIAIVSESNNWKYKSSELHRIMKLIGKVLKIARKKRTVYEFIINEFVAFLPRSEIKRVYLDYE